MPTRHHTCTTWREDPPIVVDAEVVDDDMPITMSVPERARPIAEAHDHQAMRATHQTMTSARLGVWPVGPHTIAMTPHRMRATEPHIGRP